MCRISFPFRGCLSQGDHPVCLKPSYAAFNPARRRDVHLFEAVLRGEHLLHGFRKADIRRLLEGEATDPVALGKRYFRSGTLPFMSRAARAFIRERS
jgi:hypothetical protein